MVSLRAAIEQLHLQLYVFSSSFFAAAVYLGIIIFHLGILVEYYVRDPNSKVFSGPSP